MSQLAAALVVSTQHDNIAAVGSSRLAFKAEINLEGRKERNKVAQESHRRTTQTHYTDAQLKRVFSLFVFPTLVQNFGVKEKNKK